MDELVAVLQTSPLTPQDIVTFNQRCLASVSTDVRMCGSCAIVSFGLDRVLWPVNDNNDWALSRCTTCAPALAHLQAPQLRAFIYPHGDDRAWKCPDCRAKGDKSHFASLLPKYPAQYLAALRRLHWEQLHLASLVNVSFRLTHEVKGYVRGEWAESSMVEAPLLREDIMRNDALSQDVHTVIAHLQTNCDLYKHFVPILMQDPAWACASLPPETWQHIIDRQRARDPTVACAGDTDDDQQHGRDQYAMGQLVATSGRKFKASHINAGHMLTTSGEAIKQQCTKECRMAMLDAQDRPVLVRLEQALFPYLFYDGGHFDPPASGANSRFTFKRYLQLRIKQAYSVYTLHVPYLLLMKSIYNSMEVFRQQPRCRVYTKSFERLAGRMAITEALMRAVREDIPAAVEAAPAAFKRGRDDLRAHVAEYGMATHFWTATADEGGRRPSREYVFIDQVMKLLQGDSASWHDAPVECARAFITRAKYVLDHHIMKEDGPRVLGRVLAYALRVECQGRGSLHIHVIFWIHPDDQAAVDRHTIAAIPAPFVDGAFQEPDDPMLAALADLARNKQQHKCRAACLDKDGTCKLHFPNPTHSQLQPQLRACARRYQYFSPRDCDKWTTAFHILLGLLMDAHSNWAKIVEQLWSYYVLKYNVKPPPTGDLRLQLEELVKLGLQNTNDYADAVASVFAQLQVYFPSELALLAYDIPIFHTSRDVVFVCLLPPEQRQSVMSEHSKPVLDDQARYETCPSKRLVAGDPTSDITLLTCTHWHRAVCTLTPNQLKQSPGFSQAVWSATWAKVSGRADTLDIVPGDCPVPSLGDRFIAIGENQYTYLRRPANELVRYPWINPAKDIERFAYRLVCETVAWRNENALAQNGSYIPKLLDLGLVDTEEQVRALMERFRVERLDTKELTSFDVREIYTSLRLFQPVGPRDLGVTTVDLARMERILCDMKAGLPPNIQWDPSQRAAIDGITAQHIGLAVLDGGAGVGKSLVLREIVCAHAARGVALSASSGTAAALVCKDCSTTHSLYGIATRHRLMQLLRLSPEATQTVSSCRVHVIDEYSMLSADNLWKVLQTIKQAQHFSSVEDMLKENLVLLVGDYSQLPCVCSCTKHLVCGVCRRHHIFNNRHFREAFFAGRFFTLDTCHRNNDFAQVLNAIRNQTAASLLSQAFIDDNINNRLVGERDADKSYTILCSHRADARQHNLAAMAEKYPPGSDADASAVDAGFKIQALAADGQRTLVQQHELTANEHSAIYGADGTNDECPCVGVGAPVRVRVNRSIRRGFVNGATGAVDSVSCDAAGDLEAIRVRLRSGEVVSVARRQVSNARYDRGRQLVCSAFPLALNFATTIHATQGYTINGPVYIDIRKAFVRGLAYVALSRNTNADDIALARPLTVQNLAVVSITDYYAAIGVTE